MGISRLILSCNATHVMRSCSRFLLNSVTTCDRTQGSLVADATAAAREVLVNHETMLKNGKRLRESRFWNFVVDNAAEGLFDGYKATLYGLVSISVVDGTLHVHLQQLQGVMRQTSVLMRS